MKKPGRLHRASMFTFSNRTGGHGLPRKAKDRKTRIALSSVFVAARRDRKRFDGAGVVRSLLYRFESIGGQLHLWTCCLMDKTTNQQLSVPTVGTLCLLNRSFKASAASCSSVQPLPR